MLISITAQLLQGGWVPKQDAAVLQRHRAAVCPPVQDPADGDPADGHPRTMSSWVHWTVPPEGEWERRYRAIRHSAGRKAMASSCSDSRRTVRAKYFIMDRASSGSPDTAWAASSRSMGTSSQGERATAEETRGACQKGRLAEQTARRINIQYPLRSIGGLDIAFDPAAFQIVEAGRFGVLKVNEVAGRAPDGGRLRAKGAHSWEGKSRERSIGETPHKEIL